MKIPRRLIYILCGILILFLVGYFIYTGTHLIPSESEEIPSDEVEYEDSD